MVVISQKRALLNQWNTASDVLNAHPAVHPVCGFPAQRWGCPNWRRLNDAVDAVEAQMMDLHMPHPNNITDDDLDDLRD